MSGTAATACAFWLALCLGIQIIIQQLEGFKAKLLVQDELSINWPLRLEQLELGH